MENLSTRMKLARTEAKLTQKKLAKLSGVSQGAIAMLETGQRSGSASIAQIAQTLGVNAVWLATGQGEMNAQHVGQAAWDENIRPINMHRIPVISWVRAGAFCEIETVDSDDFIYADTPTSPYAFALEVVGDSMTTSNNRGVSFPEGMVIVIDPEKAAQPGDYVIIKDINKQAATFKQYMTDGISNKGVPLNKDYDTVDLDSENYRIIGVVVEAVHRMRFKS